jgi:thiamine biosynthesis protein ThiS
MTLVLNGNAYPVDGEHVTVRALLERLNLASQPVAVEVNKKLVPKRQHHEATLRDGDHVEVVTLVGGG